MHMVNPNSKKGYTVKVSIVSPFTLPSQLLFPEKANFLSVFPEIFYAYTGIYVIECLRGLFLSKF